MSLGAGETTLLRLATGYCSIANGGHQVHATLIDRIQDRWGHTVWKHDQRVCETCKADAWNNQEEPEIPDDRVQIMDPHTAYQMTSILEGVIQRGTATSLKALDRPLAGKTGTTNEEKDAWFIGYSPDMVVGVFIGYDTPTPMGKGETGGGTAAPIFRDFMKVALADQPAIPFRVPPGIKLVRIDAKTGMRATAGSSDKTILEAYKPNEDPPDPLSFVTYPGADGAQDQSGGSLSSGSGSIGSAGGGRQPQAGGLY
jgi:penicillin-binding protein 1A